MNKRMNKLLNKLRQFLSFVLSFSEEGAAENAAGDAIAIHARFWERDTSFQEMTGPMFFERELDALIKAFAMELGRCAIGYAATGGDLRRKLYFDLIGERSSLGRETDLLEMFSPKSFHRPAFRQPSRRWLWGRPSRIWEGGF